MTRAAEAEKFWWVRRQQAWLTAFRKVIAVQNGVAMCLMSGAAAAAGVMTLEQQDYCTRQSATKK